MKNKKLKHGRAIAVVTVATLIEALLLAAFAWWQIGNYERGVAELYAQEQDGYVEVVANQISLYGEIAGEDFVRSSINFLDATSSRYWTLDNTTNFLFVKSVSETDVYKSFSTETFFNTESSQDFLSQLKLGQVSHMIITLDGYKYIASGTVFEYDGTDYRLCLLTDYDVMLSNNEYLSSKIYLVIDFMLIIALLSISIIYFIIRLEKESIEVEKEQKTKQQLNRYVEYLNAVIMGRNGTPIITGRGQILRLFHRIDERGSYPVGFVLVKSGAEHMMDFYENGSKVLGDRVIWVRIDKDEYILLMGNKTGDEAASIISRTYRSAASCIVKTATASSGRSAIDTYESITGREVDNR